VQLPAGQEKLRVHRWFFKDIQIAESLPTPKLPPPDPG
jgi:hypothetical protein